MGGGMKKLLLSTVSLLALATTAGAADMPVKAARAPVEIPTWAGFYLGIQGGVANHRGRFTDLDGFLGGPLGTEIRADKTGGLFGVNAGYNFQSGNLVYGLEGDWNWLGAKASSNFINGSGIATNTTASFDARWLATARARLGLASGATLFYGTGGVAFGQLNNNTTVNFASGAFRGTFSQDTTKVGWTAGGGIEHMLGPHWTVRAEVRYVDLGKSSVTCNAVCNGGVGTYRGEFRNSLLLGLLALDYKF
jgi:outer membrane immunogenic protein